ncbi:hypothetical protein H4R35_007356 [Dimargaris xerosporica]|nr:hypothetical protein H4R35_007356 [Dimargaris xerosporica]
MKSMYRVGVVALVASTRWLPQSAAAPNLGFGASPDDMHLSGDPLYDGSMAGLANGYLGVKQPNNPTTLSSGALDSDDDTTSLSSSNTSLQSSSLWSDIQSGYDQVSDFLISTWQNTFGTKENVPTVLRTSVEVAGGFGPMLRNIVTSLP